MKNFPVLILAALLSTACSTSKQVSVQVSNSLGIDRKNEIVELSKNSVWSKLNLKTGEKIVLLDNLSNQIAYQIAINFDNSSDSLLIFPATVKANGSSVYTIKKGTPKNFQPKVAGRLVPERKDDFNWENDRIAFRMYGPALQATGEVSNGIDIWAKRTDKLVADKWYADELSGKSTYHTDSGEGLDFYKVGPTLGAGAAAPYVEGRLWFSKNFTDYKILDKGPLRITFQLNYDWFETNKGNTKSVRIISLDAGNQLNKIRQSHEFGSSSMLVAAGVVLRNLPDEKIFIDKEKNYAIHAESYDKANGTLYEAIVSRTGFTGIEVKNNHLLGTQNVKTLEYFTYYAGGGWSKYGFENLESWKNYVSNFTKKIKFPLKVTLK